MKKPINTVNTSTSELLTNQSNSLTHALSSPYDALHHAPPYTHRLELVERENAANNDLEDGEEDDDDNDGDDIEDDDVEERDYDVDDKENLMTRQKLAEGFFEVEAIRKKRISKGVPQYLIKWRGWPESANTWEPVDHLQTCPDVVEAYEESLQSGQKKSSSKRKRKFTQQKKKTQFSYGPTKSKISPAKISLGNDSPDSATLDNSKNAHRETSMIDIVVKHDEAIKRARTAKKVDHNGSQTLSPSVDSSENDHSDPVQLSGQNASVRNSDVHLQQPVNVGDDLDNQLTKSIRVEEGQSSQRKGARRRKSGSVRRFTQDVTSLNIDCFGTPLPVNGSTSEGVDQLNIGDVFRKKRSDSSRSTTITKIIKPISYSTCITNDAHEVSVTFVVMRSDGKEVMVDNKYLKATNPFLLINFYEEHLRYNPT